MDPCGWYRGFVLYRELDGWWAETPGGICFGPHDSFADVRAAVDAYREN